MPEGWYVVQVRLEGVGRKWVKVAVFRERDDAVKFIQGNEAARAYEFRTVQRQPKWKPVDPV